MAVSIDPDGVLAMSTATLARRVEPVATRAATLQATIDSVDDLVGYRPVVTAPHRRRRRRPRPDRPAGRTTSSITYVDDDLPLQVLRDPRLLAPRLQRRSAGTARCPPAGTSTGPCAPTSSARSSSGTATGPARAVPPVLALRPEARRRHRRSGPGPRLRPPEYRVPGHDVRTRAPAACSCRTAGRSTTPSRRALARGVRRAGLVQARRAGARHGPGVRPAADVGQDRRPAASSSSGRAHRLRLRRVAVGPGRRSTTPSGAPSRTRRQRAPTAPRPRAAAPIAGAWAGGEIGAMVGSFVPIPVVGTVGGALIGAAHRRRSSAARQARRLGDVREERMAQLVRLTDAQRSPTGSHPLHGRPLRAPRRWSCSPSASRTTAATAAWVALPAATSRQYTGSSRSTPSWRWRGSAPRILLGVASVRLPSVLGAITVGTAGDPGAARRHRRARSGSRGSCAPVAARPAGRPDDRRPRPAGPATKGSTMSRDSTLERVSGGGVELALPPGWERLDVAGVRRS